MARAVVYLSLDSPQAVEDTCDQRRLRSDCADAQSDLSLRWSHKSYCRFCRALAHMYRVLIRSAVERYIFKEKYEKYRYFFSCLILSYDSGPFLTVFTLCNSIYVIHTLLFSGSVCYTRFMRDVICV